MSVYEAKITSKGQVTLPAKLRSAMRLSTGDTIVFEESPDGSVAVRPKSNPMAELFGIIKQGPKVTGADIERFIDEARGAGMPAGLARALELKRRRNR